MWKCLRRKKKKVNKLVILFLYVETIEVNGAILKQTMTMFVLGHN